MNSNYETPEVLDFGRAQSLIRGMKVEDPISFDAELGPGYRTLQNDIDEGEE